MLLITNPGFLSLYSLNSQLHYLINEIVVKNEFFIECLWEGEKLTAARIKVIKKYRLWQRDGGFILR